LKLTAAAAILCSTFVAGAANATTATANSCFDMAQQVKAALAANAQSPNYQDALKEQNNGQSFCSESFYQYGINHYSRALTLLGASKN
jgi:hypothetical protein